MQTNYVLGKKEKDKRRKPGVSIGRSRISIVMVNLISTHGTIWKYQRVSDHKRKYEEDEEDDEADEDKENEEDEDKENEEDEEDEEHEEVKDEDDDNKENLSQYLPPLPLTHSHRVRMYIYTHISLSSSYAFEEAKREVRCDSGGRT